MFYVAVHSFLTKCRFLTAHYSLIFNLPYTLIHQRCYNNKKRVPHTYTLTHKRRTSKLPIFLSYERCSSTRLLQRGSVKQKATFNSDGRPSFPPVRHTLVETTYSGILFHFVSYPKFSIRVNYVYLVSLLSC